MQVMKKILSIVLVSCIICSSIVTSAENNAEKHWKLAVDEMEGIQCDSAVLEREGKYFIELKWLIETMGATVREEESGVFFNFFNVEYVAQIRPLFFKPEENGLYIGVSKWITDENQKSANDWSAMLELGRDTLNGEHILIDNCIYMSFDTCYHLLYELGCNFKVSYENKFIQISLNTNNPGELYVNDKKVDIADEFLMIVDEIDGQRTMFVPVRAVLESAGVAIQWEGETGNINVQYAGKEYVCIKVSNEDFLVCEEENLSKNDNDSNKYLEMHTGVEFLPYCIVKDRTYMPYIYFRGFIEAIGFKTEFSMGERIVKVWSD